MTESDDSFPFENLVLEGGGARGFAYCGAIHELGEMGVLHKFTRFAGTSVGALFAALLVIGFTAKEISEIDYEIDLSPYTRSCCLTTVYHVWNQYGLFSTDHLESEFRKVIQKRVDPDITLKELFDTTQKELVIVTCSLNQQDPVYLHHGKYPDVKLIDALICSISVPFGFRPRQYNFTGTSDYYVDGGLVDNYPIWVFNDMDALYRSDLDDVEKDEINPKTLGLKLLCKGERNTTQVFHGRKKIANVFGFALGLINTLMLQVERGSLSPSSMAQTVPIRTGDVYFMDFQLSDEDRNKLIKNGKEAVRKYFDGINQTGV